MLLYGDSNCEGYEAAAPGVSVANQDASLSHAILEALGLQCEIGIVAFAGQGYSVAVANANVPALSSSWDLYFAGQTRLVSSLFSPAPDYIVCVEGQNDGIDVTTVCGTMISNFRGAAPNAQIIIGSPVNQSHASELSAAAVASGDAKVHWVSISENLLTVGGYEASGSHISGLRGHPRYAAMILAGIKAATATGTSGGFVIGG
jgi:hypothetical protein